MAGVFTPDQQQPSGVGTFTPDPAPGWDEVVSAIPGAAKANAQQAIGGLLRAAGDAYSRIAGDQSLAKVGAGIAESGKINAQFDTPKNMTFAQESVLAGGSSLLTTVPALALGPGVGVTALGVMQGGQTYDEARTYGLSPGRSFAHAAFEGAVESLTEYLPAKALFGQYKSILAKLTAVLSKEYPGEVLATVLQDASAKLGYRPDMTAKEFIDDILLTIGATTVSAPLLAGGAYGLQRVAAPRPTPTPPNDPNKQAPPVYPNAGVEAQETVAGVDTTVFPQDFGPLPQPGYVAPKGSVNEGVVLDDKTFAQLTYERLKAKQDAGEVISGADSMWLRWYEQGQVTERPFSPPPPVDPVAAATQTLEAAAAQAPTESGGIQLPTSLPTLNMSPGGIAIPEPGFGRKLSTRFRNQALRGSEVKSTADQPVETSTGTESKQEVINEGGEAKAPVAEIVGGTLPGSVQEITASDVVDSVEVDTVKVHKLSNGSIVWDALVELPRGKAMHKVDSGMAENRLAELVGADEAARLIEAAERDGAAAVHNVAVPRATLQPRAVTVLDKVHQVRKMTETHGIESKHLLPRTHSVPNVVGANPAPITLYGKQVTDSTVFGQKDTLVGNTDNIVGGKVELLTDGGKSSAQDKKLHAVLQRWVTKFLPEGRVVLVRGERPFGGRNSVGAMLAANDGVYYIYISNTQKLSDQFMTLAHEFGHVLITDQFYKADKATQDALFAQYHEFLTKLAGGMTGVDYITTRYGPDEVRGPLEQDGNLDGTSDLKKSGLELALATDARSFKGYTISFDEYYADQFTRYAVAEGEFNVEPEVQRLMDRALEVVRAFFKDFVDRFAPGIQFKTWVKGLAGEAVTPEAKQQDREQNKLLAMLRKAGIDKDTIAAMRDDNGRLDPREVRDLVQGTKLTMPGDPRDLDFTNLEELDKTWAGGVTDIPSKIALLGKSVGQPEIGNSLTRFNWFIGRMASLLQINKMNQHVPGMQEFTNGMRRMFATKSKWTGAADSRIEAWRKIGKEQSDKLSKILLEEARSGKFVGTVVQNGTSSREQTYMLEQPEAEKRGLSDEAAQLYADIHGDYLNALNSMELRALEELWRIYAPEDYYQYVQSGGTPEGLLMLPPTQPFLAQHIANTQKSFSQLRESPYLPFTRFGRNAVLVKALDTVKYQGKEYKKGETVYFAAFETTKERNEDLQRMKKETEFLPVTTAGVYIKDEEYNMRGLPPALANVLKVRLQLDEKQASDLNDILTSMTSSQAFVRHLQKRKGVAGYSEDVMRVYADYFLRFGNYMSRLEHGHELDRALDNVAKSAQEIVNAGGVSDKRDQLHEWLFNLRDYVMKPKNELEDVRGALTVSFLMFNVKSAMVNGFQVPFVTVPYLSKDYTWAKAFGNVQKAYKDVLRSWNTPNAMSQQEWEAIQRGLSDGFLDESFASALANTAEGGNLLRALPAGRIGKGWEWVKTKGMVMFQRMEEINRRVTFLAAYRLGLENGLSQEVSYTKARQAIEDTQNEYAKWNRPEFMRGPIKSLMFMFMQYQQNMIFQMYGGDKSWARLLGMHLALAGLMGLPFAGNIKDLVKWFGKLFDQHWDLEADARQFIADIGANPDWIMSGVSHNFFGADLSGSLSMGRPIPGTEALANEGRFAERVLSGGSDIGGAGIGMVLNIMQAIADDNPDTLMRVQRAMPTFLGNAAKGISEFEQGGKVDRNGAVVAEVSPAEAVMHGLFGFNPAQVAAESREYHAKKQLAQYWLDRRSVLMGQYYYASEVIKDREAAADVRERIRRYNSDAPDRNLIISQDDLRRSVKAHLRAKKNREAGIPIGPKARGLAVQVEDQYQTDQ